jgi:hypothetical protein
MIFMQYREKITESLSAPYEVIITLKKMRSVLPYLEQPSLDKPLKVESKVVYKVTMYDAYRAMSAKQVSICQPV